MVGVNGDRAALEEDNRGLVQCRCCSVALYRKVAEVISAADPHHHGVMARVDQKVKSQPRVNTELLPVHRSLVAVSEPCVAEAGRTA